MNVQYLPTRPCLVWVYKLWGTLVEVAILNSLLRCRTPLPGLFIRHCSPWLGTRHFNAFLQTSWPSVVIWVTIAFPSSPTSLTSDPWHQQGSFPLLQHFFFFNILGQFLIFPIQILTLNFSESFISMYKVAAILLFNILPNIDVGEAVFGKMLLFSPKFLLVLFSELSLRLWCWSYSGLGTVYASSLERWLPLLMQFQYFCPLRSSVFRFVFFRLFLSVQPANWLEP